MSYLPHLYPVGAVFFITFRLGDSLPQSILRLLKEEYEGEIKKLRKLQLMSNQEQSKLAALRKKIFGKYDHQLDDQPYGECYMKDENVAKIIYNKIMQYNGGYYNLLALSIMPNHVHVLLDTSVQLSVDTQVGEVPDGYVDVSKWMKLIKGGSAHAVNKYLGRKGQLWAHESYDHFARDEPEIQRIIDYILANPVKAGLGLKYRELPYMFSQL